MRDAPSGIKEVSNQHEGWEEEWSYAAEVSSVSIARFDQSLLLSTPDSFPGIPFYQPIELSAVSP
jgi:hypothetical protein